MSEWESKFYRTAWTRAVWKRHYNHVTLHFEGHRDVLIVGFDSEFSSNASRNWAPWGSRFSQANDISYLGFSSNVSDWYLDAWIEAEMSTLVRDGFFDQFSRVVFVGHSMGGYAALRFSQMVQGAYVAAFSPQTTLEAARVPFDDRYPDAARLVWRGDDTDVATHRFDPCRCFVFYDPYLSEDAGHADLLGAAGAQLLRSYYSRHGSFLYLNRMGIVDDLMQALCFGTLTPDVFYLLFRQRRTLPWFRGAVLKHFEDAKRPVMVARFLQAFERNQEDLANSRCNPKANAIL